MSLIIVVMANHAWFLASTTLLLHFQRLSWIWLLRQLFLESHRILLLHKLLYVLIMRHFWNHAETIFECSEYCIFNLCDWQKSVLHILLLYCSALCPVCLAVSCLKTKNWPDNIPVIDRNCFALLMLLHRIFWLPYRQISNWQVFFYDF